MGWAWRGLLNVGVLLTLISRLLFPRALPVLSYIRNHAWNLAIDGNIRRGRRMFCISPLPSDSLLSDLLTLYCLAPQFPNARTNRHCSSAETHTDFDNQPYELIFSENSKSKTARSTQGTTSSEKPSTSRTASRTIWSGMTRNKSR